MAPNLLQGKSQKSLHWPIRLFSVPSTLSLAHSLQPHSPLLFLQQTRHHPSIGTMALDVPFACKAISSVFCMAITLTSLKSLLNCHHLNNLTWAFYLKLQPHLLPSSLQDLVAPTPETMPAYHVGLNQYLLNVEWMKTLLTACHFSWPVHKVPREREDVISESEGNRKDFLNGRKRWWDTMITNLNTEGITDLQRAPGRSQGGIIF